MTPLAPAAAAPAAAPEAAAPAPEGFDALLDAVLPEDGAASQADAAALLLAAMGFVPVPPVPPIEPPSAEAETSPADGVSFPKEAAAPVPAAAPQDAAQGDALMPITFEPAAQPPATLKGPGSDPRPKSEMPDAAVPAPAAPVPPAPPAAVLAPAAVKPEAPAPTPTPAAEVQDRKNKPVMNEARVRPGVDFSAAPAFEAPKAVQAAAPAAPAAPAVEWRPIVRRLDLHWRDGQGEISFDLAPRELGEVKVRMEVQDGAVTVLFKVDNEAARAGLQAQAPELSDALRQLGWRVDQVRVSVGGSAADLSSAPRERRDASSPFRRTEESRAPRGASVSAGDRLVDLVA